MTNSDIVGLAERVELATSDDERLLLIRACEASLLAQGYDPDTNDAMEIVDRFEELIDAKAYLDAAMTLVPEDCLAMVKQLWDGKQKTALGRVSRYGKTMWTGDWSGLSSEPALALCAAALRARAALSGSPEG